MSYETPVLTMAPEEIARLLERARWLEAEVARLHGDAPPADRDDRIDDVAAMSSPASHDVLFSAAEKTRMPMILTDPNQPDDPIIFVNRAFQTLSGYDASELLGRNCRFLQGPLTERDKVAQVRAAIAENRDIAVDIVNYRKDGTIFVNELYISSVFDRQGRLLYRFGSQLDITGYSEDRRRLHVSEAVLQASAARQTFLLGLADHLRVLSHPRDVMSTAVETLGRHLGVSRVGYGRVSGNGQTIERQVGYSDRTMAPLGTLRLDAFVAPLLARQRRGETVAVPDVTALPGFDPAVWDGVGIRAFVSVPLVRAERFVAALYVTHDALRPWSQDEIALIEEVAARTWDAVERAQAEAALRAVNESLEQRIAAALAERETMEETLRQSQKMEAIGQLTGGVAHDFNNLLTIIRSSVDFLRRRDLPEERRRRYIDAVGDTVDRAAKLTGQLLAFARRQALKPEVFEVGTSLRAVADLLNPIMGAPITVEVRVPDAPCHVRADLGQFETALVNMAVNARDAMEGEGRLTLMLTADRSMPAIRGHAGARGAFAAIAIADTGAGIPPGALSRIFEPFFTTKEVGRGTGLGLSQVFGFAKQSGGDVDVTSTVGGGTTFTLYLPQAAAGADPVEEAPDEITAAPRGAGRRVLVVEDNLEVGHFATQTLEDLGYVTTWAKNAAEALARLREDESAFDVVFSDVVMPGMNGVDLGREIRRLYPRLPVILASGYSHVLAEEGRHGFELLHKPYSVEQLSRVLRQVARGRPRSRA